MSRGRGQQKDDHHTQSIVGISAAPDTGFCLGILRETGRPVNGGNPVAVRGDGYGRWPYRPALSSGRERSIRREHFPAGHCLNCTDFGKDAH